MAETTQPLERCPACGGRVVVTTGAGHAVPYAGALVPLPEELPIESCEGCGALRTAAGDAVRALEPELARRAAAVLTRAAG